MCTPSHSIVCCAWWVGLAVFPILKHEAYKAGSKGPVACGVYLATKHRSACLTLGHQTCRCPAEPCSPTSRVPEVHSSPDSLEQRVRPLPWITLVGLWLWVLLSPLRLSPPLEEESYFQPSICFVFNVQKGCTFSGTLFISSRLYNSLLHKWRFLLLAFVEMPNGRENITCLAVPIRKNEKALNTSRIVKHRNVGNQIQKSLEHGWWEGFFSLIVFLHL